MSILRPYPIRPNYWSSSKFADVCREYFTKGNVTMPVALPIEEWDEWRESYKTNYPKTYLFLEVFLDKAQNVFRYPFDVLYAIRYYCKNRFIHKTHIVSTGAKKGEFLDHEVRMLNAIMNILVDFVENDSSIEHLTWETALVYNEEWGVNSDDPKYNTATEQALGAQTFLEVYNWWKNVRPTRKDPYDNYDKDADWKFYASIEQSYQDEDNLMIEKLLKYRHRLWT